MRKTLQDVHKNRRLKLPGIDLFLSISTILALVKYRRQFLSIRTIHHISTQAYQLVKITSNFKLNWEIAVYLFFQRIYFTLAIDSVFDI